MSYLFSENKWYLVSPLNDGNWSTVVNDWYAASNITGATFYRLIYKLKAPVTHGVALTNDNWESIDIDSSDPALEANTGYWVYVEQAATQTGGSDPVADNSLVIDKTNKSIRLKKSDKSGFSFKSIQLSNTALVTATTAYSGTGTGSGELALVSGTGSSGTAFVANPGSYQAGLGVPYIKAQSTTPTAPTSMAKLSGDDTLFTFNLTGLDTSSWDDTYKPSSYSITLYNTSGVEETISSGLTIVVL